MAYRENEIDAVVSFCKFSGSFMNGVDPGLVHRYRSNVPLRMLIGLIRKNLPFVKKVFVVVPDASHLDGEDLSGLGVSVVENREIIPEKFLPTHNCNCVSFYLSRIDGVARRYIYFCDDYFPIRPMTVDDFECGGKTVLSTFPGENRLGTYHGFATACGSVLAKKVLTGSGDGADLVHVDHVPVMFDRDVCRMAAKALEGSSYWVPFSPQRDEKWSCRNASSDSYFAFFQAMLRGGWVERDGRQRLFSELGDDLSVVEKPGSHVKLLCVNDRPGLSEQAYTSECRKLTAMLGRFLGKPAAAKPDWYKSEQGRVARGDSTLSPLWRAKADEIVLVHCMDYPERLGNVMSELDRVGITGSGVFRVENTAPIPAYLDAIERSFGKKVRKSLIDYQMALYRIMRHSISAGYKRVITVEDDAVFLKDLSVLEAMLNWMPDADIVKLDWMFDKNSADFHVSNAKVKALMDSSGNKLYFEPDSSVHGVLWNSTVMAWSRRGMEVMLEILEDVKANTYEDNSLGKYMDPGFRKKSGVTFSVAKKPMAIQAAYENHASPFSADYGIRISCGQNPDDYVEDGRKELVPSSDFSGDKPDWRSLFDGVYVTHLIGQDDRFAFLKSELRRIGVPDDMLHVRYAFHNRFSSIVTDRLKQEHGSGWNTLPGWTDAAMNNLALLHEARHSGFSRILLIENDVAFLKDLSFLGSALSSVPDDAEMCQLEYFAIDNIEDALDCVNAGSRGNMYWGPGLYPQRGGACTILKGAGIDKLIEYWDNEPVPTDYAYRHVDCVRYHSKVRLAVQAQFSSGAIAASNAIAGMSALERSWYSLPGEKSGVPPSKVSLPKFPLEASEVVDAVKTLSKLMSEHPDYREPPCLMARVILESTESPDTYVARMLLDQGLRVSEKKDGLPVDEWCWNGGPENLLASIGSVAGRPPLPDGSIPIVL